MRKQNQQRRRLTLRLHLDIESSSSSAAEAEEVPARRAKRQRGHWGNNQHTTAKVASGELCYICTDAAATHPDGFGGRLCWPCLTTIQQGRKAHYMRGYRGH
jgi:hypothetical protein